MLVLAAAVALVQTLGCAGLGGARPVRLDQLEAAPLIAPAQRFQAVVSDPSALPADLFALGPRFALIQVRRGDEWTRLRAAAPGLPDAPDFASGMVAAIVSRVGTPVGARWPIEIEGARVTERAALLQGRLLAETYLPDAAAFIEAAYLPDCDSVLVVEINGTRFFPR